MSKIIVCLGYRLNSDGSIHTILENRLKDSIKQVIKNPNSLLILMGSVPYIEKNLKKISESEAMWKYIKKNFSGNLRDVKIKKEKRSTSTIEQLCFLKENIKNPSDLIIVSSEFFGDRVRLYTQYIFGSIKGIQFVESKIPDDSKKEFRETEVDKLSKAKKWLKNFKKGEFKKILKEQKIFQRKVKQGKASISIS